MTEPTNVFGAVSLDPRFDARDLEILRESMALYDLLEGPRVGDFVVFKDGVVRRVSYVWRWPDAVHYVQTSQPGTAPYLGEGYASFSGSLYQSVPADSLSLAEEKREGLVWFFHHGFPEAHMGVTCVASFRVYRCSLEAPV